MSSTAPLSRNAGAAPGGQSEAGACDPRWLYAAAGLGAAIFFYLQFFHLPFEPIWIRGDQAIYLDHAERMLHGEVLYRNLFEFNLPGTEYLYYFLFLCFGVRLWIVPLAMLITLTASTLLVYSLSRVVLRGIIALLPAAAFLIVCQHGSLDGTHHSCSTLQVLLAVNLIVRARNSLWLCCAGALLGLASVFTSSLGMFVAAGVSLFFLWKFRGARKALAPIAALLAPFVAVIAAVLAYLAILVGPRLLYEELVVFSLRYYPAGSPNRPSVFFAEWNSVLPLRAHSIVIVAYWLAIKVVVPFAFVTFFAGRFRTGAADLRGSRPSQALALYAFAGSSALLAVAGSMSAQRLSCAAAFACILGTAMLQNFAHPRLIGAALAVAGAISITLMTVAVLHPIYRFASPRGSVVLLNRDRYEMVAWLARNARPGDRLFGDPDLNFLLGLRDPASIQWVENDAYTRPEQVAELLITLDQFPIRFFMWGKYVDRPGPGESIGPLRAYLKAHYHLEKRFGDGAEVLEPNTAAPPDQ